jgi:AcrR family transcriptional regulator
VSEAAPDSLRTQRWRGRHQRILAAAVAEIERVGIARARIGRICRDAEVTRPTFYAHFPTREHVLLELQRRAANAIAESILSRLAEAATLSDLVDALVDGLFAATGRASPRLRREILSLDVRERRPADWEGTPLYHAVRSRFEAARHRGEIAPRHDPGDLTRWALVTLLGFLAGGASDLEPNRADARNVLRLLVLGAARGDGA